MTQFIQKTRSTTTTKTDEVAEMPEPVVVDTTDAGATVEDLDNLVDETIADTDEFLLAAARGQRLDKVQGQSEVRAWTYGGRCD